MRENGLKLPSGRLKLDIRERFFSERVVMRWHRLPGEVVVFYHSLRCSDVALRDALSRRGGDGLAVGLSEPTGLFQP